MQLNLWQTLNKKPLHMHSALHYYVWGWHYSNQSSIIFIYSTKHAISIFVEYHDSILFNFTLTSYWCIFTISLWYFCLIVILILSNKTDVIFCKKKNKKKKVKKIKNWKTNRFFIISSVMMLLASRCPCLIISVWMCFEMVMTLLC